jgi:hypothetical protein
MAGLLCGLGFFVLLQLGLGLAVEGGKTRLRDPFYDYRLQHLRRQRAAVPGPLVVMLGSSRTVMGLRGGTAGRRLSASLGRPALVINFGISGGGALNELVTWQRLRDDGVRADLTLIEVLPPLLADPAASGRPPEAPLCAEHLRRDDLTLVERYGEDAPALLRPAWGCGRLLPWHTHRIALLSRLVPQLLPQGQRLTPWHDLDATGSLRQPEAAWPCKDAAKDLELAKQAYAPCLARFRLGERPCAALRRLLDTCRRSGAPAVLVLMPEGPHFRSWYPAAVKRQIDDWLATLSREYRVPLLDARGWFVEDDFWDSHHLRPPAAERFSERLVREAVLPRLAPLETASGAASARRSKVQGPAG